MKNKYYPIVVTVLKSNWKEKHSKKKSRYLQYRYIAAYIPGLVQWKVAGLNLFYGPKLALLVKWPVHVLVFFTC